MPTYKEMIREAASYVEQQTKCPKHHVEHTGSLCYLLDFYDQLGEVEKAKKYIQHLLHLVVESGGAYVFYPGHINPMNMSQNVIDTGSAVDAISRFAHRHTDMFTSTEHDEIKRALRLVVESYLSTAAVEKTITNQRLWGLTGLASWARYVGEEDRYRPLVRESIERALSDMSADGFFWYVPRAKEAGMFEGYAGVSAFYQSRCTAFMHYAADCVGLDIRVEFPFFEKAERALCAMYDARGIKDMRIECKRWYWLSQYEVAASGFDAYAISRATPAEAKLLLRHVVHQARSHMRRGRLLSHHGRQHNFQCPIFWTAHLAWLLRIPDIEGVWDSDVPSEPYRFRFVGAECFADISEKKRVWVSRLTGPRNITTGVYHNGLPSRYMLRMKMPHMPPWILFSLREVANHTWCALRGFSFGESCERMVRAGALLGMAWVPLYSVQWGRIESIKVNTSEHGESLEIVVHPGSLFGTYLDDTLTLSTPL